MFVLKFEDFSRFHVFTTLGTFGSRLEALQAADHHKETTRENGRYHVFRV